MSFGWSVGDIALAIKTVVKVGKAVRETGGAASEYQDAVSFLTSIEKTLRSLEALLREHPNLKWEAELIEQGNNLKSAIGKFKDKIEKYERSLGEDSERGKAKRVPREVQFAVFVSDQVKELRAQVMQPQVILDNFIALQMLTSILDLSRDLLSSQENFERWSERISPAIFSLQGSLEERDEDERANVYRAQNEHQHLVTRFQESLDEVHTTLRDLEASRRLSANHDVDKTRDILDSQVEIRQSIQALHDNTRALHDHLLMQKENENRASMVSLGSWQIAVSAAQVLGSGVAAGLGTLAAISSQRTFQTQKQEKFLQEPTRYASVDHPTSVHYERIWGNAFRDTGDQIVEGGEQPYNSTDAERGTQISGQETITTSMERTAHGYPKITSIGPSSKSHANPEAKAERVFNGDPSKVSIEDIRQWRRESNKNLAIDPIIDHEARGEFFRPGRILQTEKNLDRLGSISHPETAGHLSGLIIGGPGQSPGNWLCLMVSDLKMERTREDAARGSLVPPVKISIEGHDTCYYVNVPRLAIPPNPVAVNEIEPVMSIGLVENWQQSPLHEIYLRTIQDYRRGPRRRLYKLKKP